MWLAWPRLRAGVGLISVLVLASGSLSGQVPDGEQAPTTEPPPDLPPGAVRYVNHARQGEHVAICAEEPGGAITEGSRPVPRTRVWVHDGHRLRQVATAAPTCDPAWSADGGRVAVVAPDGLWVLTADLRVTMHLVDTRHTQAPGDEAAHRTLAAPAWSPDGALLAYQVRNQDAFWVEVAEADTGDVVYTSEPETDEFEWGADSRSLLFGSRVVPLEVP